MSKKLPKGSKGTLADVKTGDLITLGTVVIKIIKDLMKKPEK